MNCASMLPLILVVMGCGVQPAPRPVPSSPTPPPARPASTAASDPPQLVYNACVTDAAAVRARVSDEWGTPDSPRISVKGGFKDANEQLASHEKTRQGYHAELRAVLAKSSNMICSAHAHVHMAVVDDILRAAVRAANVNAVDPATEKKLSDIESRAHAVLNNPGATPEATQSAKALLDKATQIRTALNEAWTSRARAATSMLEPELVDFYVRGLVEARKAAIKSDAHTAAWRRMGVLVDELGVTAVHDLTARVRSDHPDVAFKSEEFRKPCAWPSGC